MNDEKLPAAGWEDAIEACQKIASEHDDDVYVDEDMNSARGQVVKFIVRDIEALRHNAPPDSGAGKSEPPHWREVEMMRLIDLLRSKEGDSVTILCDNPDFDFNGQPNCAIVCNGGWTNWQDLRFAQDTLLDALSAAMIEYKRPRDPAVPPDHGGADAGVRVKPLEWEQPDGPEGTAWLGHGTDMCQYYIRFDAETASYWMPGDVPSHDDNDHADEFFALDDAKAAAQADYEHRILSALSHQPAPVAANASAEPALNWQLSDDAKARIAEIDDNRRNAALNASSIVAGSSNASAEARLREALQRITGFIRDFALYDQKYALESVLMISDEALSAHPHASDCAKQGE